MHLHLVPGRWTIQSDRKNDSASASELKMKRGENKMSNAYAAVSALIFAIVSVMHVVRLINRWPVVIGPYNISMNASWAALVVGALLSIWGFMQLS